MNGQIKFVPSTWRKVAQTFETSGIGAADEITSLVDSTTDPAACNAAGGLATVDGAVSLMLTAFGSVMHSEVLTSLTEGLESEAGAIASTGIALEVAEDDALGLAKETWR